MSVKPIDIVKTQEAAQYKLMELQRTQQAHDQLGQNFHTMINKQHNKTQETTRTETPEFRYDAKEKGKNQYDSSKEKRKKSKEEAKKNQQDSENQGGFDILI